MNLAYLFLVAMNKALLKILLFITIMIVSVFSNAVSNRIVAIVNDDVVTENELNVRIERIKTRPSKAEANRYNKYKTEDELRYQVLKALVEESVLVQKAKQLGVTVSQSEVDNAMLILSESMEVDLSSESNKRLIASLRKEVESEVLISKFVGATLARSVSVSTFEVDEVMSALVDDGVAKEYQVSQLFIRMVTDEADKAIQQAQVESWRQELIDGASMEDIVKASTFNSSVPVIRNLDWKTSQQLPDLFLSQLNTMKRGEISKVIASPNAFHILRLIDVRGGENLVEKRSVQHILISANTELEQQHAIEKLHRVRNKILLGGDFSDFAAKLSDDSGSAAKGGDLGWVHLGDTVAEFEKTLFKLKVSELSQPIVTVYGVHLLKLNEVKQEDISNQAQRSRITEQIRRRKIEQQYSSWLSDMVSKSYIDYLVD